MARIKGSPDGAGYYHVMSRTVSDEEGGLMLFGAQEKNVFAKQLRKHAEFAGIEVLTWCMMDNHFHLLIRVPEKQAYLANLMSDGRRGFWRRLRARYSSDRVKSMKKEAESLERKGDTGRLEEMLAPYTRRMADLSAFVQGLKYAFSIWFNRNHDREGTLWMRRFKSVLLEGETWVLNKVSAYIDLNPVRAGLVNDPGKYRWSGYGQAVGGVAEARRGLSAVYGYGRNEWRRLGAEYRKLLYLEGVERKSVQGKGGRAGVSAEEFYREMANDGREGAAKRLANRVRYFADGAAIGSREFLEGVFANNRTMFGPKRRTGARKLRGPVWKGTGLYTLRDLTNN